ncbi:uncharacterized protein FA14DRAFT_157042 [Meira miltonrushii]|uniref:Uncharacterized protein n=1 Tax=Meira miltonrushii TaxID=1280837 RepID=A0A316VBA5_9BASI|nr:uncharacterized protein FA14DRAFT_157042 [Meira miltonrushii]PWN34378.1 hypothetical protein FA14DRAFT_157042 [Meira miltonrushii]
MHPPFNPIRWVPVAIITMNWFFLPSHEHILAPRTGNSDLRLDASEKIVKTNASPSKRDNSMESAAKWHIPASLPSLSKRNTKRDRTNSLKKRDGLLTHILRHYPTAASSHGNSKRATSTEEKQEPSSEDRNSSPLKRNTSPESAIKWHYPTASKKSSPFKPPSKRRTGLAEGDTPSILSSRANMEHPTLEKKEDKASNSAFELRSPTSMSSKRDRLLKRMEKWEFSLESSTKEDLPTKRTVAKIPGKKRLLNLLPDTGLCLRFTGSDNGKKSAFARDYAQDLGDLSTIL